MRTCDQISGSKEETVSSKPDDLTIPWRLRILAAERGQETAIQALPDGGRLTFHTWNERSDAAARGLAALAGLNVAISITLALWMQPQ